ncbi:MAG: hypothetical protein NC300_12525 [Bacteroidales bacterium]|nr:type II toxin-antitoxin system RelE/ParE family toxin [Clostridium sp.]MCM1204959.1 hypothetical protein [Bacteroidales bacterium]
MTYKIVVSERANMHLDNILSYIVYKLKNKQAARAVYDDVKNMYDKLEYMAGSVALCEDSYLAEKGYHKLVLDKHDYILLFQIYDDIVYVNGIFHMLENYREKL